MSQRRLSFFFGGAPLVVFLIRASRGVSGVFFLPRTIVAPIPTSKVPAVCPQTQNQRRTRHTNRRHHHGVGRQRASCHHTGLRLAGPFSPIQSAVSQSKFTRTLKHLGHPVSFRCISNPQLNTEPPEIVYLVFICSPPLMGLLEKTLHPAVGKLKIQVETFAKKFKSNSNSPQKCDEVNLKNGFTNHPQFSV